MSSSRLSSHRKGTSLSSSKTKSTAKTTATPRNAKSGKTASSQKSTPHDPNFQQKLTDDHVLPYGCKYPDGSRPPLTGDWEAANRRLAQYRPSLSPSVFQEELYQEFVDEDAGAHDEDAVKESVLPAMLKAMGASKGAQKNIWLGNLDPMARDISQAQPDYYYGAQPEQLDPEVREELSKRIVPSSSTNLPIVPNFFLEAKGPNGSLAVAQRQACHDGAIGARAMHSLQTYGQSEPVYDNNLCAISTTYHGGTFKMYSHSVAQPNGPDTRPEYYMHQLKTYGMTSDKETFLKGATAFKNAMDLTREHRNAAIARANEIASQTMGNEDDEEEDEDDENDDETDDEEVDATSSAIDSFMHSTLSKLAENDDDNDEDKSETEAEANNDDDEDEDESETSVEDNHQRPPF